ncbi:MAG: hypothetical protein ACJ77K_18745 [Bacteroidia bacterium]
MKRLLVFLFAFSLLISCDEHFEKDSLYGYYTATDYKNTFDTIQLKPHGLYHRRIYDKNNKLALELDGTWRLEQNRVISLDSYFFNLDRDIVKFPELLQDTVGSGGGHLETKNGVIQFCVGYYYEDNCYQKVK